LRFWFYNCKHVLFLHSAKNAHFLDALITNMFSRVVKNVFADSSITARDRLARNVKNTKIISMLRYSGEDLMLLRGPVAKNTGATLKMIYWGRLHPVKNLIFSIKLVEFLRSEGLDVYFSIVGPMTSYGRQVSELVKTLGLEDSIKFHVEKDLAEIAVMSKEYSFYLSTSRHEGLAMSVVEGMQLGLVPVVVPVGDIGQYCRDSYNSLFVDSSEVPANLGLVVELKDKEKSDYLAQNASATWVCHPSYRESLESVLCDSTQIF
jgi:glycosyltransferase involved in cell wall biosynthesis